MRTLEEIKNTPNLFISNMGVFIVGKYFDKLTNKYLDFMFSVDGDYEHLSVSTSNKVPTWDQMARMKEIFFKDEEECIQFHPKKSEYVDLHSNCLHIWRIRNNMTISEMLDKVKEVE